MKFNEPSQLSLTDEFLPVWFISWQGPRWDYFSANRWPVYYSIGLLGITVIWRKNGIVKTFLKQQRTNT